MAGRVDQEELARRQATAEFLRGERERYEYLLLCASDAEDEELAWETIAARMTVRDFVTAVNEVLAARDSQQAAAELRGVVLDDLAAIAYETCTDAHGNHRDGQYGEVTALLARARQLLDRVDPPLPLRRPDPAAGHADPEGVA